mgnify:CR=1 FL=1
MIIVYFAIACNLDRHFILIFLRRLKIQCNAVLIYITSSY